VSSKGGAWSVALGVLSVLVMPVAITATRYSASYTLPQAGFAIPVGIGLGIAAIVVARRAGALDQVRRATTKASRTARVGRLLGILGICMGSAAAISISVYGLLIHLD
jgi:hypothetical protein